VVTAGNGSVFIWNAANGANLTAGAPSGRLDGVGATFSPDGKRFALFGSHATILDAVSFREVLRVSGDIRMVGGTAMSRDGQFLAVAEDDGVHLWRQGSGWKLLPGSVGGQRSNQITFAFSRDGKRVVTPGTENTLRIFDTATAQESATLYYDNKDVKIKGVAFSADGEQIFAAADDWTVYRFATPLEDVNAEARRLALEAKASLTDADCAKYLHQKTCPLQVRRIP
jgi:WD40 repeat protein